MLKPRKRITKRELKEDPIVKYAGMASKWIENNLRYITIGVSCVLIAVVVMFVVTTSTRQSENDASAELARATRAYQDHDYSGALEMLNGIVEKYGRTRSGKLARYYLARTFYQNQDYENAQLYFEKFVKSFSGNEYIKAAAMGGIAACLEQKEEYTEAARQYERIVEKYPETILASGYLIRAARCYTHADQLEKANELYKKIIDEYPDSQEKDEAVMLGAMLPE